MFARSAASYMWLACSLGLALAACGRSNTGAEPASGDPSGSTPSARDIANEPGRAVIPPFAVRGELDGLLLAWFDQQGLHSAKNRSEIPEARRAEVRVQSLGVAPDQRLDPEQVYVADLRAPGADGSYRVHVHSRAWFDARVDSARPAPAADTAQADTGVTIYKAAWCGVCRSAAAYLRSRNVRFVEKDIEKDAEANAEMQKKARAAGKHPTGVPVIDFHGHLLMGFDQATLEHLISQYQAI